jgi:hypothetical protein
MIVSTAIEKHRAMINQMKTVPGVLPDRWRDAFTVRYGT